MLVALCAASAARADGGQPLSVPTSVLEASLNCPASIVGAARAPVLLIPGTNLEPGANYDWNYERALTAARIPWCTVTLPRFATGDIQVAAEYVVAALRRMHDQAGRRVSVIGFSQGGMVGRWALKYWPDTRGMIDDLVGLAPSNHGTTSSRVACVTTYCPPAFLQQSHDSKFVAALNTGPETWPGIDYTVVYTHADEIVTPNADAKTGSSSLRTGAGGISDVAVQDICPLLSPDHLALGSFDPVGWALAVDALGHDGPADPARIDRGVCTQGFMPGVRLATFPVDYARYTATIAQALAQSEEVRTEPALRCYVTATCPAVHGSGPPPTAKPTRPCARRSFTIRLDRRLRHASARIGGRRVRVRRVHGRLIAHIDLRGRRNGPVNLVIRGVTRQGRYTKRIRPYRVCADR